MGNCTGKASRGPCALCQADWGTQEGTFIRPETFEDFFAKRYGQMVAAVHDFGWHFILHSCGKVNAFVPCFIDAGVDVLNLQQPQAYGIEEIGRRFAGRPQPGSESP